MVTLPLVQRQMRYFNHVAYLSISFAVGFTVLLKVIFCVDQVFIYHKAFPMPALSFKFQNTDPLSGNEVDDAAQFVSSVCWRGQSSTLLAANSTGNVKILEMV